MNSIQTIMPPDFPYLLKQISDPPKKLFIRGTMPSDDRKFLTVVGSRAYTDYGKEACEKLIASLKGYPVVIVSGLALGIDSIAHRTALEHGIPTIAFPGSGLGDPVLYPPSHHNLAQKILKEGGALISPFDDSVCGQKWAFQERNRLMAGISHAVLVIEARKISGTLITSKYAHQYNRDTFAVPGSIFSSQSSGPHRLIREGATPITCGGDLIEALGFEPMTAAKRDYSGLSLDELKVIEILARPRPREGIFATIGMEASKVNTLLSILEMKGLIEETLGEIRRT